MFASRLYYLGLFARKPVFGGLRTTKAQTSLRIRAVWSAPFLFTFWKAPYLSLLQAKSQLVSIAEETGLSLENPKDMFSRDEPVDPDEMSQNLTSRL